MTTLKEGTDLASGLSADGEKRPKHPTWYAPKNACLTGLNVLNSLTETIEPFVPREGRQVKWYTCGPTVYDMSHMGHARAYLTFDILRRIMEDYFGYSIQYQMNITDIDDKIILHARVNKLLDDFRTEVNGNVELLTKWVDEAVAFAKASLAKKREALEKPLPADTTSRLRDEQVENLKVQDLKESQFAETVQKITTAKTEKKFEDLFTASRSVIGPLLDDQRGGSITDSSIFEAHARKYERAYFEDMERLGIREPDVITRVTEYVPQVTEFIQKIMDNGFAYKGETSVFFDTEAYIAAGHSYPKLRTGADKTTDAEMAEGEGTLSKAKTGEKKSGNDFALWKFSKPGEPRWPSPWGEGRPGWHIECSVMASDLLGDNMDIHAGGWDLKFPHHDNECAQSEAFSCTHQWVNYFFHCGHLHIENLKMSKSLKNFITIRQAFDDLGVTAREMRLLFLSTEWAKQMNFSNQSIGSARETDRVLRAFFGSVDIVLRQDYLAATQGFNLADRALNKRWVEVEQKVHEALCNNMNTVEAMSQIMALVSETNQYLLNKERPSATLVRKIAIYITKMLRVFGVVQGSDEIGFSESRASDNRLGPVCDALVQFRDDIRQAAREKKPVESFLPMCDALRDEALPPAGIRLEDKPGQPTQWKTDDPSVLMREVADRKEAAEGERLRKLQNVAEKKQKLVAKWKQFVAPPVDFFRGNEESAKKYSAYDEAGLPTKTIEGEDVTEKQQKKLKKDQDKYAANHTEYMAKGGAEWLKAEEAELEAMLADLNKAK